MDISFYIKLQIIPSCGFPVETWIGDQGANDVKGSISLPVGQLTWPSMTQKTLSVDTNDCYG